MAKAKKECVYMKGMTEALKKGKVPLSPAVKANGFVFVSGLPTDRYQNRQADYRRHHQTDTPVIAQRPRCAESGRFVHGTGRQSERLLFEFRLF